MLELLLSMSGPGPRAQHLLKGLGRAGHTQQRSRLPLSSLPIFGYLRPVQGTHPGLLLERRKAISSVITMHISPAGYN